MMNINIENAFDVLEQISGISNSQWLYKRESSYKKTIVLPEGALTKTVLTKMMKNFGKLETFTNHNGVQYSWDLPDGNRVTGYARYDGDHELGYIKFE
jgi:hypothetical protein